MGRLERALERLRGLGLESPYEAWRCVEHGECPEEVDYMEAFNSLMDYLELVAEKGGSPVGEWEKRYMEELEAEEERRGQRLPVHA